MRNAEAKSDQLLTILPKYGLNPDDWKLQKINSKNYVLKYKHDKELCLWGEVSESEDHQWKELQWVSF